MGKGSITKRKDGRWQGAYQYTVDGKRYTRYIYAHTKLDCTKKLHELINEIIQRKET